MSSSKQFSLNEFFKMSLEQYLLMKCTIIKQSVEEALKKEEKRQIIQDFINEFIAFAKHVIGKNSKNSQIIIAEIIEKLLILDFNQLRCKEEDIPKNILNRPYKIMILQFDRIDLHILQFFTRLQCLKLMYEFLTVSEKVPKRFNYREKFYADLTKHLDQIKVYSKMNFSTSSEGDCYLLKIFRSLLQNCNCIEFYTFLNNFNIRNELNKEVKKFIRNEYAQLSQKYSVRQSQQNQKLVQQFNEELSKSQILQNTNPQASNPQQILIEGNSQGSENFNINEENGNENRKQNKNQLQSGRRQFNAIFLDNKLTACSILKQQNQQNVNSFQSNENKSQNQRESFSKQYLSTANGENSLSRLIEEENSNNFQNKFAEINKKFIQQNNNEYSYTNCHINSEENTQFNLLNFKGFSNYNQTSSENDKNVLQNRKMKSYSFVSDNDSNNIPLTQTKILPNSEGNIAGEENNIQKKNINTTNQKITTSNNQKYLSKPIQNGRTMYSDQNKKILRNSQAKPNGQLQKQTSNSQIRSSSKNIQDFVANSNISQHNVTTNILLEAAKKLLQEQDQSKKQNKAKIMSRESKSDQFVNVAAKAFKSPQQAQENYLEGYQNINNHQSNSEDENSIPLRYMWGHN